MTGSDPAASVSTRSGRVKSTLTPVDAGGGQRPDRDLDHLARGGDRIATDQFAADLTAFARGLERGAAQPQDRPGIAQPHRARMVRHPGRGDPADLRGDVGADREPALADRIDEAHRGAGAVAREPVRQRVLELDQRRIGALVAVGRRDREHRLLEPAGGIGMRRQPVAKALGKQRVAHAGAPSPMRLRARGRREPPATGPN